MAANFPPYAPQYSNNMMSMQPQYGTMMPQDYRQMPQPQPQFGLKGRPVSSLEEVRGTTIDFDGSIFYFPDIANKRIYTKQINLDGTATLNVYELKQIPLQTLNADYVTRQEFDSALHELKDAISLRQVSQVQVEQPQVIQPQQAQPQQQIQPQNTTTLEPLKF